MTDATQPKEAARLLGAIGWPDTLSRDFQYALRTLLRDLGFATFAILIVGLGIGACCTIFSVVNTLLIRPLPFRDPASLVWIANGPAALDLSVQTMQVATSSTCANKTNRSPIWPPISRSTASATASSLARAANPSA